MCSLASPGRANNLEPTVILSYARVSLRWVGGWVDALRSTLHRPFKDTLRVARIDDHGAAWRLIFRGVFTR